MILIQNALVLTPSAEPQALDVLVDGGTIADAVPRGTVKGDGMERVDAAGRALMPGLVNGHNHAQTGLSKGLFDRYNLETYLNAQPGATGRRTLEDKHLSALIGAAEMVRKGCTAGYDMFAEFPLPTADGVAAVARAYSDAGMRAAIAPMMADKTFYEAIPGLAEALPEPLRSQALKARYAPGEETLSAVQNLLKNWKFDRERIKPALGPTIPHHCSDQFLAACRDLAKELGVGIQMHVAESKMQAAVAPKIYGESLVAHLARLKLLNEKFCVAHGVWLDDDDRKRLADAGCSISHNPGSNLKLGSGIADMRAMLARGLNVAIGTDGAASSDNLNAFEAMRLACYLSRAQANPPERWVSAREAFYAATEGGAKALGFDKLGRIEKGWKADLVLLDLSALHYIPLNDLLNQIVFAEDGTGVESVMIGGRWVMRERKLLTVDVQALKAKAEEAVARLRAANAEAKALGEKLQPYVGHFCAGLTNQASESQY
ncbi:MAG TPA: amidohydrolase [Burkholderiales bacterium]|nr:amidohydrolase [Burkholderiales bacterium]